MNAIKLTHEQKIQKAKERLEEGKRKGAEMRELAERQRKERLEMIKWHKA